MQPLNDSERRTLLQAAAKTFPDRTPETLENELNEYESLGSLRFTCEGGELPAPAAQRFENLAKQFQVKP